jgi:hypothetical protein
VARVIEKVARPPRPLRDHVDEMDQPRIRRHVFSS